MSRAPRIVGLVGVGLTLAALSATSACNDLLGNVPPGSHGEGGEGGEDSDGAGGASASGGSSLGGSSSGGASTGGGSNGSGGSAPLPDGAVGVALSGLVGAVELEANGESFTFTENGNQELELEPEVGDLVTVSITDQPPGQLCLFGDEEEAEQQYTGETLTFELTCVGDVATLASLTTDLGDLDFSSSGTSYSIDPPFVRYQGSFTATLTDPTATLRLDGDEIESDSPITIPLPTSLVTLSFEVEAASGRTRTYEVQVERQGEVEFVDSVSTIETDMDNYGHDVAVDEDRFAVLAAGIINLTDAAIYVYDFDTLAPVRTFDALDPMDCHEPHFGFSGGHVAFTNADYQHMSLWADGEWNAASSPVTFVYDGANYCQYERLATSVSGDTLAVGGFSNQRVYVRSGDEWTLEQEFAPFPSIDPALGDPLYHRLHGDTLVVGGTMSGWEGVSIFERSGSSWDEALVITKNVTGLAVGEGVVAVGIDDTTDRVEIYERNAGTWAFARSLYTSDLPLAIHGPIVVLGSVSAAQIRLWTTDDFVDSHSVNRGDTSSTSDCTTFAASAAMNEHGLVVCDRCSECAVFR